jgi:hypothetical protein
MATTKTREHPPTPPHCNTNNRDHENDDDCEGYYEGTWYSDSDYDSFLADARRSVWMIHDARLQQQHRRRDPDDEDAEAYCADGTTALGLENYLISTAEQRARERQCRAHVRAVLDRQRRLRPIRTAPTPPHPSSSMTAATADDRTYFSAQQKYRRVATSSA